MRWWVIKHAGQHRRRGRCLQCMSPCPVGKRAKEGKQGRLDTCGPANPPAVLRVLGEAVHELLARDAAACWEQSSQCAHFFITVRPPRMQAVTACLVHVHRVQRCWKNAQGFWAPSSRPFTRVCAHTPAGLVASAGGTAGNASPSPAAAALAY